MDPSWELTPVDGSAWAYPRPGTARPKSAAGRREAGTPTTMGDSEEDKFVYFEITDASTGHVYQCARANDTTTTKLYYEEGTDTWKVLPAAWEAAQPSTARLLEEIDAVLPQWRNVTEQVRIEHTTYQFCIIDIQLIQQVLALRLFQYDVSATIAWKSADVEASGGHWGTTNVQQTALIKSLEEALAKKGAVIDELRKAEEKSDRVLSQAGRDLEQREQELKDTTEQLQRSRKRITILEEELACQFEDLQKQSTRQRGRIAVLESELESTIALSTGTKNRQEQQIASLSQKVKRLEDAEETAHATSDSKIEELRIELVGARTEAAEAAELRREVAELKAKLLEQKAARATAEDKSAEATALRQQLAEASTELQKTADDYRASARATAIELETTKAALEKCQSTSESTIAQLRSDLAEKQQELAETNKEGMVSMSEVTLLEKEEEMKRLRNEAVVLQEQVASLKHGSSAMVGTIKFTVQDLKAAKEVLQRDTRSIISGAATLWQKLHPAIEKLLSIVVNFEADKQELVRKYQLEVFRRFVHSIVFAVESCAAQVAAKRLLYNKIQELKGNIRCFCRVRKDDRAAIAVNCISDCEILIPIGNDGRTKCYEFDKVRHCTVRYCLPVLLTSVVLSQPGLSAHRYPG